MASPIQQFIENYMMVSQIQQREQQMLQQQRQFDAQAALTERQVENSEIQNFVSLLGQTSNREEIGALINLYESRAPQLSGVFQAAAQSYGPTRATQLSEAGAVAGPQSAEAALAISEGRRMTAGQEEQAGQFEQSFAENQRQFGATMGQRQNEFAVESGLRSRGLDIQEFSVNQQGALGQAGILAQTGLYPMAHRAEQSTALREVTQAMADPSLMPEERAGLQQQQRELENSLRQLDNFIAASMQGTEGGIGLNQLYSAREAAYRQLNEATDPGMQKVAAEAYNDVAARLGFQQVDLGRYSVFSPLDALLGGPRPVNVLPQQQPVPFGHPGGAY